MCSSSGCACGRTIWLSKFQIRMTKGAPATLGSPETRVLGDDWTVVTTDGSRAAHWENTVAVTDEGLWVLTALDGGKERLEAAGAPYAPLA